MVKLFFFVFYWKKRPQMKQRLNKFKKRLYIITGMSSLIYCIKWKVAKIVELLFSTYNVNSSWFYCWTWPKTVKCNQFTLSIKSSQRPWEGRSPLPHSNTELMLKWASNEEPWRLTFTSPHLIRWVNHPVPLSAVCGSAWPLTPLAAWRRRASSRSPGRAMTAPAATTRRSGRWLSASGVFDTRFTGSTRFMCPCATQQALLKLGPWRIKCCYTPRNVLSRDGMALRSNQK